MPMRGAGASVRGTEPASKPLREALEGLGVEKSPYLESIRKEERLKTQSRAVVRS